MSFASSAYCLGVAYYYLEDYSHARLLFQECMKVQTKLLGESDVHIARSLCWLGRNNEQLQDPSKALERYLSALQICKKNKSLLDYRVVAMLLHAIGKAYEDEKLAQPDMALRCYIEEINLIQSKLNTDDVETNKLLSEAHFNAGVLYQKTTT
eukprot:g2602.t1 g2602   contig12:436185-436720(+)